MYLNIPFLWVWDCLKGNKSRPLVLIPFCSFYLNNKVDTFSVFFFPACMSGKFWQHTKTSHQEISLAFWRPKRREASPLSFSLQSLLTSLMTMNERKNFFCCCSLAQRDLYETTNNSRSGLTNTHEKLISKLCCFSPFYFCPFFKSSTMFFA